jgi:hypothetical protein
MPGMCKIVAFSSHPRVPIRRLDHQPESSGPGVGSASQLFFLRTRDLDRGLSMESVGIREVSMGGERKRPACSREQLG